MTIDMQAAFRDAYVPANAGPVFVIGSKIYPGREDWRKRFPMGFGVDMEDGEGVDIVHDIDREPLHMVAGHVECCSVMEHTRRPWLFAENLQASMAPGASIFLSVPWVWRYHAYPGDLWRFSHETLPILFPAIDWRVVKYAVNDQFTDSPRMPKMRGGLMAKMQLMAYGVKG